MTLTGSQKLDLSAGNVLQFSVNMSGIEGINKAVSLHYAELTKADVYAKGITGSNYKALDLEKTYKDKWQGYINYNNEGFGLRNTSSTNDSYLKLPDFAEKIETVTIELSQPFANETDAYLSLETAADIFSKSIASLDQVNDQMTYVFDVSSLNVKTAYLRATGSAAYISKVIVTTEKTDTRTQLSAPSNVTASLSGTNDIIVSWTKAENAVGYEIVCTPTAGVTVITEVGDVASYKVEGLANETQYTVSVASIPDYYENTKSVATSASSTVTTGKGAYTYTFTGASWTATLGGIEANWTSGTNGAGFSNNGVTVTKNASDANATSPRSFTNVSKIVVTYNTNKSAGEGSIAMKVGTNDEKTNNVGFSGTADGRSANFTTEYTYATPQSGNVKITVNTNTNSLYIVSIAITADSISE